MAASPSTVPFSDRYTTERYIYGVRAEAISHVEDKARVVLEEIQDHYLLGKSYWSNNKCLKTVEETSNHITVSAQFGPEQSWLAVATTLLD